MRNYSSPGLRHIKRVRVTPSLPKGYHMSGKAAIGLADVARRVLLPLVLVGFAGALVFVLSMRGSPVVQGTNPLSPGGVAAPPDLGGQPTLQRFPVNHMGNLPEAKKEARRSGKKLFIVYADTQSAIFYEAIQLTTDQSDPRAIAARELLSAHYIVAIPFERGDIFSQEYSRKYVGSALIMDPDSDIPFYVWEKIYPTERKLVADLAVMARVPLPNIGI